MPTSNKALKKRPQVQRRNAQPGGPQTQQRPQTQPAAVSGAPQAPQNVPLQPRPAAQPPQMAPQGPANPPAGPAPVPMGQPTPQQAMAPRPGMRPPQAMQVPPQGLPTPQQAMAPNAQQPMGQPFPGAPADPRQMAMMQQYRQQQAFAPYQNMMRQQQVPYNAR